MRKHDLQFNWYPLAFGDTDGNHFPETFVPSFSRSGAVVTPAKAVLENPIPRAGGPVSLELQEDPSFSYSVKGSVLTIDTDREFGKIGRGRAGFGWRMGESHYGAERRESGEAKANRMIGETPEKLGWTEADLKCRQKGDPVKVRLARKLRDETTMTLKWIADRLCMGKWTNASNLLRKRPANENKLELNECQ